MIITCTAAGAFNRSGAAVEGDEEVSHGLQLQSLWTIPTAAVSGTRPVLKTPRHTHQLSEEVAVGEQAEVRPGRPIPAL